MKKVNLSLIVVLLFMFALASITWAFQNEPDGFRGLKWGDPPTEDMSYVDTVNVIIRRYRKVNEKLSEGNANLEFINYNFYGEPEKLFSVYIVFHEEDNFNDFKELCRDKFGEPTSTRIDRLRWWGEKAAIELNYYSKDKGGELTLSSRIGVTEATRLWTQLGKPEGISKDEQRKTGEVEKLKRLQEQNKPPYYNEPDGFRGLKWGDPPREDMVYYPELNWYKRKDDKLEIGGARLEKIFYKFHKGKFKSVFITTGDYKSLKDVVDLKFGAPTRYEDFGFGFLSYEWSGSIATVKLIKGGQGAVLEIYSTQIYTQEEKDIRLRNEEETRLKEEERRKAAEEGLADFDYIPETKEEKKQSNIKEKLKADESKEQDSEKPKGSWQVIEFQGPITGRRIERWIQPDYPQSAEGKSIKGRVKVKCWVLPSGEVSEVEIRQTSGWLELDKCAYQALMKCRFERIEEEEKQWGIVTFFFHLDNEQKIEEKVEEKVSIKDQIAFISMESIENYSRFQVKFKEKGEETGVVIFECDDFSFSGYTIKRRDGSIVQIADTLTSGINEVGTVDLNKNGNEDVFFVWRDGGTGMHHTGLNLINTKKCEIVGLVLSFSRQLTEAITEVSTTDNFHSEDFQKEREFLEGIKYEYGFIGEEEINKQKYNPEFAYYFWAQDNGGIENGKMTVRKYKGKHKSKASIAELLKEESITYTAYFKGGVVAYDEQSDEHFILFHPDYMYSYVTVLRKMGPYLLIGTQGEGLAAVNVENFHLKRFRFDPPNDYVKKLEILDSMIRINDSKEINLPNF